jgi:cell division protein FtsN
MPQSFTAALLLAFAVGHVPVAYATAQVQPAPTPKTSSTQVVKATLPSQKAKKKSKPKPAAEPVQYAPSGEALPAREKRLRRECKGRPNAGACLGHAS